MNYWFAFAIGIPFGIAVIDWIFKGMWKWEDLDELRKGYSWHITIIVLFYLPVIAFALSEQNPWLLFGLLGIANEDFIFYLFKSAKQNRLWPPSNWCWNAWFFSAKSHYYRTVGIANFIMFVMLTWKA